LKKLPYRKHKILKEAFLAIRPSKRIRRLEIFRFGNNKNFFNFYQGKGGRGIAEILTGFFRPRKEIFKI